MDLLRRSIEAHDDLQLAITTIRAITYLMRGAIFKPLNPTANLFLKRICPFGQLVDMFHSHQASLSHDKIYALLGMSSDDLSRSGLYPNYRIPFEKLLHNLVNYVLSNKVTVKTNCGREAAVVVAKGYVLGRVVLVKDNLDSDFEQRLQVTWLISQYSIWLTFPASATALQAGDLVCLIDGATKPTIVRVYQDFLVILVIAAPQPQCVGSIGQSITWLEALHRSTLPLRGFKLVWDWHFSPKQLHQSGTFTSWAQTAKWEWRTPSTEVQSRVESLVGRFQTGIIVSDACDLRQAERKLQEAIMLYDEVCQIETKQIYDEGMESSIALDAILSELQGGQATIPAIQASTLFSWTLKNGYIVGAIMVFETKGVNISIRDEDGRTALQAAAEGSYLAIVERLLQENADINASAGERGGRTALQAAAEGGHLAIIERLRLAVAFRS